MAVIAFVPHRTRPQAATLVRDTAEWLEGLGHEVRIPAEDAEEVGLEKWAVDDDLLTADLDLAVSVGGDGTMLRTVHLVCDADVPVLGVNVGHLGYLTEVEPAGMTDGIVHWLEGRFHIERRMTLQVEVVRGDGSDGTSIALNDAVIQRTGAGHTVRVGTTIDGSYWVTYVADALIVATPTGSTAYNLSARGPIVSPGHRAIVLTPVAPHMLLNVPLVLSGTEEVRFDLEESRPADLVVDGQTIASLDNGDAVVCRAGPHDARLVTFHRRDFHRIVKAKFGLES